MQMSCTPCLRRYGTLPALNRHFYAISLRWPIHCGVWQLAEPATPLTAKVCWHL